jgi:bifunctional DNA-binding transcriptional regulator/antitoxin component of YhaV-PrlF toxin-antitoxin module
MLHARIEKGFRITIPEPLRLSLREGDDLLVNVDAAGRILMMPASRALEVMERTAGMWRDRADIPVDGVAYVQSLRSGR